MKNIVNIFQNKKIIIKETDKAIKVKIKTDENELFVWMAKKFVYPGKYENSICLGIILDQNYELLVKNQQEEKVYAVVEGKALKSLFEAQKKQFLNNTKIDEWKQEVMSGWLIKQLQNKIK